jgi:hypothetical protein
LQKFAKGGNIEITITEKRAKDMKPNEWCSKKLNTGAFYYYYYYFERTEAN